MADRRVTVDLNLNNKGFNAGLLQSAAAAKMFSRDLDSAGKRVDVLDATVGTFSKRLHLAIDILGAVGPAAVPIGALAVPAVTGLANALGMAVASGATAIIAFQGVGDALSKVNKAHINPTTTNLKNARIAMSQLSDQARDMVRTLSGLTDEWHGLRDAAAAGLFPGLTESLDIILARAPEVENILRRIGEATGEMATEAAVDLTSGRWDDFFTFLSNEAPKSIAGLAQATGNLAHAFAELWMDFQPLNNSFLDWVVSSTAAMDRWATGLDQTEGFQEFIAYIKENGPEVGDLLGSIAMALVDILEAAAPIGSVTLPILTMLFNIISAIADSPLGTPLVGLLAVTKAMSLLDRATKGPIASVRTLRDDLHTLSTTSARGLAPDRFASNAVVQQWRRAQKATEDYASAAERTRTTVGRLAGSGGAIAGFMAIQSGLTDQIGLTNTVLGTSIGLMSGPWGAAIGGGIGLLFDLAQAGRESTLSVEALTGAMNEQTGALELTGLQDIATELQVFQGGLDAAGISLADATSAAAAGGGELEAVLTKVNLAIAEAKTARDQWGNFTNKDDINALVDLRDALTDTDGKMNEARKGAEARAAAQEAAAAADDEATGSLLRYNDALGDTIHSLMGLNGLLKERDLTRAYNQAWIDLNKAVKENGEVFDKTKAKGIDNLSKLDAAVDAASKRFEFLRDAGRDAAAQSILDTALRDLRTFVREHPKAAAAARDLIRDLKRADRQSVLSRAIQELHAFKQAHPSAAAATELLVAKLKNLDNKAALTKALADLRAFKQANPEAAASVQPLIDKLKEVARQHPKPKIDVDTDSALRKLGRFQATVNALHGNEVLIRVRTEHVESMLGGQGAGGSGGGHTPTAPHGRATVVPPSLLTYASGRPVVGGGDLGILPPKYGPITQGSLPPVPGGGGILPPKYGPITNTAPLPPALRPFARAFHQLELVLADGADSIRSELRDLKDAFKDAEGKWTGAMQVHAHKILKMAREYDKQTELLGQQQDVLQGLIDTGEQLREQQSSFAAQVTGNFTADAFGHGLAGFFQQTSANTSTAGAFLQVLQQLAAMGLDGPAFQALAASGDLQTAIQLRDSGMIDQFDSAVGGQATTLGRLGAYAGNVAFGEQIRNQDAAIEQQSALIATTQATMEKLQAAVDRQEQLLRQLAGLPSDIKEGVRRGSYNGSYSGVKDSMSGAGRAVSRDWNRGWK